MRPPYLRRLERRRRLKFLAAGFIPILAWVALSVSGARLLIHLTEHHP